MTINPETYMYPRGVSIRSSREYLFIPDWNQLDLQGEITLFQSDINLDLKCDSLFNVISLFDNK